MVAFYNAAPSEPGTEEVEDEHQEAGETDEGWAEMGAEQEDGAEPSS